MKFIYLALLLTILLIPLTSNNIVSNLPMTVTQFKSYTSNAPTWLTSPFFRAGQEDVISTFTGSSQYPFRSYTFTYSSALPGVPNLAYGIQKYRGNDYLGQEFYQIRQTGRTATTFSVEIQIFGVTNLWILAVAYLAADPTFPHHLNSFDNIPINYTSGNIVNITQKSQNQIFYTNYINYTSQAAGQQFTKFPAPLDGNYVVIFMTSLWIKGTFGKPLKFHIYPQIVNQTHYMWNITLWKNVLVTNVHFSEIIFNSDDVESSEKYYIVFQKWYNDIDGGFLVIPEAFKDNFIMGITSFENSDAACGFQYQWDFTTKTVNGQTDFGVEILRSWTLTNTCGFSWSESSILYMMTWECLPPYKFFNITTGQCQTACGAFSIQNDATGNCDPCGGTCYQCSQNNTNQCTFCATYLFYNMTASGDCQCIEGYVHINSTCQLCSYGSIGCINCSYDDGAGGTLLFNSSHFVCLECNTTIDYFLDGVKCKLCSLSNCIDCQSLTRCAICQNGYDFSDIQTCIVCTIEGCANCLSTNTNKCAVCNQTLGYYNNATNSKCSPKCGDGILVSGKEGCDDNNTDNYDGCSDACVVETGFDCSGSPSECFFKVSATLSVKKQKMQPEAVVCNTITFQIQISPKATLLDQSYINWTNFISTPNTSLMNQNKTMLSYSSGAISVSYFLKVHLQNKSVTFNADFSTLLSNSSIFSKTSASALTFNVDTNPEALMACCKGFFMNTTTVKCDQICGDGMLFNLDCDDGNLINGDGCSQNCTQQSDYTCIGGSSTAVSVCSYTGPVQIDIVSGNKIPTSNSMKLTFKLDPIDPLMLLNNGSTDFTDMVGFPGFNIQVAEAYINEATKELVIVMNYFQNLQGKEIVMEITPPPVPQAALVSSMNYTWKVQATNQLSVIVYSDQDYKNLEIIDLSGKMMVGACLTVVGATLLLRKFIGLQMATLMQMGYLSLLQNKAISLYMQPITQWSFIFGYNNNQSPSQSQARLLSTSSYNMYGYGKTFGESNNIMVLAAAACFALAAVLLLASALTSKGRSRKLRNASFIVASDLAYALIVFLTPNIISAIYIEAKQGILFKQTELISKLALLSSVIMLLLAHFINVATAEHNSDVGTYLRRHGMLSIYMPIIFNIRLVIISVLLFVHHLMESEIPTFGIMGVQLVYIMYLLMARPHKKSFDFCRCLVIELGLLYILSIRYVQTTIFAQTMQSDSSLYLIVAIIEYAIYGIAILLCIVSLFYHLCKKINGALVEVHVDKKPEEVEIQNDSVHKLESKESKRSRVEKESPVLQNVEEIDIDDLTTPKTSVSIFSLDPQPARGRKMRMRRQR